VSVGERYHLFQFIFAQLTIIGLPDDLNLRVGDGGDCPALGGRSVRLEGHASTWLDCHDRQRKASMSNDNQSEPRSKASDSANIERREALIKLGKYTA